VVALFAIEFVAEALLELQSLRATYQRRVVNAIETQLAHEPAKTARQRKQLVGISPPWEQVRPVWQLRVGDFRVFYDVDAEDRVVIIRSVRRKGRHTTEDIL
jgi:mRNA-degrading endonuclease RelE of RelBE toxin-antitoxin system